MTDAYIKRFDHPDEVRTFERGKYEVVNAGSMVIGRATYQPGWKWSEHVSPLAGTPFCETDHVGIVISGHAKARMTDGREIDLTAGDLFVIGPGHDSWVVGNEPYVSLHFFGASTYATK